MKSLIPLLVVGCFLFGISACQPPQDNLQGKADYEEKLQEEFRQDSIEYRNLLAQRSLKQNKIDSISLHLFDAEPGEVEVKAEKEKVSYDKLDRKELDVKKKVDFVIDDSLLDFIEKYPPKPNWKVTLGAVKDEEERALITSTFEGSDDPVTFYKMLVEVGKEEFQVRFDLGEVILRREMVEEFNMSVAGDGSHKRTIKWDISSLFSVLKAHHNAPKDPVVVTYMDDEEELRHELDQEEKHRLDLCYEYAFLRFDLLNLQAAIENLERKLANTRARKLARKRQI